jgi:UDP-N-acetylglucosamine 4-epimerase
VDAKNQIYNVAVGGRTDLNTLYTMLKATLKLNGVTYDKSPIYRDFRTGDVMHSQADITKIEILLGYKPEFEIAAGIEKAMPWYVANLKG